MSTHVGAMRAHPAVLPGFVIGFFLVSGCFGARAQNIAEGGRPAIVPIGPGGAPIIGAAPRGTRTAGGVDDVERGRALLADNDARAIGLLRGAAQRALDGLRALAPDAVAARDGLVDFSSGARTPGAQAALLRARERTARAHFWWGSAETRLGDRDRAITALARAVTLSSLAPEEDETPIDGAALGDEANSGDAANALIANGLDSTTLSETRRDALQGLNGLLRQGLPLVAPDDVLQVIASRLHGGLWRPRRFRFDVPIRAFSPSGVSALSRSAQSSREFLITSGKLFPSETRAPNGGNPRLWRVAPLYAAVRSESLPSSLKMDRTIAGYERETSGPYAGLWRQKARVFYASTYVTRDNRDDRPRAESLCAQFLKVSALMRAGAGVSNRFSPDGVTNVWLCEVSARWPSDNETDIDGDATPMRPTPPLVPVPTGHGSLATREIESTPLSRPWRAGARRESFSGDILLFRMTQGRDEAEWLRELVHEYSHIAMPPFAGFAPPLEPFGNGAVGETLAMLWAATQARADLASSARSAVASSARTWPRAVSLESSTRIADARTPNVGVAEMVGFNASDTLAPVQDWEDEETPDATFTAPSARNAMPRITPPSWSKALETHVSLSALPALRVFAVRGPFAFVAPPSRGASDGAARGTVAGGTRDDLRYLQGLAVYLERVYGARLLKSALLPLATRGAMNGYISSGARASSGLNANSLLNAARAALLEPFESGETRLPIWLPGALSPAPSVDAAVLSARAPLRLRAGQTAAAWLFVPTNARVLRVQWRNATPGAALRLTGNEMASSVESRAPASGAASLSTLTIATNGRAGWRRLVFQATGALTVSSAWFERAAP